MFAPTIVVANSRSRPSSGGSERARLTYHRVRKLPPKVFSHRPSHFSAGRISDRGLQRIACKADWVRSLPSCKPVDYRAKMTTFSHPLDLLARLQSFQSLLSPIRKPMVSVGTRQQTPHTGVASVATGAVEYTSRAYKSSTYITWHTVT